MNWSPFKTSVELEGARQTPKFLEASSRIRIWFWWCNIPWNREILHHHYTSELEANFIHFFRTMILYLNLSPRLGSLVKMEYTIIKWRVLDSQFFFDARLLKLEQFSDARKLFHWPETQSNSHWTFCNMSENCAEWRGLSLWDKNSGKFRILAWGPNPEN